MKHTLELTIVNRGDGFILCRTESGMMITITEAQTADKHIVLKEPTNERH